MSSRKKANESTASLLEQLKKEVKVCNKNLMQRNSLALSQNKFNAKSRGAKKNPFTNKLNKVADNVTVLMGKINQLEQHIRWAKDFDLYQNKLNTILSNYILTQNNHVEVQAKVQHATKGRKANLASKSRGVRGRTGR